VCVDANAGQRAAAIQRDKQRKFAFQNRALGFYNKETGFKRAIERNIVGYQRTIADYQQQALYQTGQARGAKESATIKYLRTQKVSEGGRSRRFGLGKVQDLVKTQANIDRTLENIYGRGEATANTFARRQFLAQNAASRKSLGLPPIFGLPTPMPPTDRLSGALKIGSAVASIAAPFIGPAATIGLGANKAVSAQAAVSGLGAGLGMFSTPKNYSGLYDNQDFDFNFSNTQGVSLR
tara:strand:+ start:43 stop:753 length:711 start_codon:yes stop_codon:yes gene_type:complete